MADMLIDQMEDENEFSGCCGYDDVMYEEESNSFHPPYWPSNWKLKIPTCKFCGKSPLIWRRIGKRWILHETSGEYHDCPNHLLPLETLKELFKNKMNNKEPVISGTPFENYIPPSWDEWFLKLMYLVAEKSKDPKTKIGALLVKDRRIISTGYNGLCRGVNDNVPERLVRPEKYFWFEHAERNSVYAAAYHGISTEGATMYTNGTPCTDCARAVIQAGITKVIVHKPYEDMSADVQKISQGHGEKWQGHNERTMAMFKEAGVILEVYPMNVGAWCYFDGKRFSV